MDLQELRAKVKKGLECCSKNVLDPCIGCPYERIGDDEWKCGLNADVLFCIEQLERERDAAIADVKESDVLYECEHCAHRRMTEEAEACERNDFECMKCEAECKCKSCRNGSGWEWARRRREKEDG